MMLTRVVEDARVRAAVKRVHMQILKTRLRPKKEARIRNSMILLWGARPRLRQMKWDQEEVRRVVVL